MGKNLCIWGLILIGLSKWVSGFEYNEIEEEEYYNRTELAFLDSSLNYGVSAAANTPLMVGLTLIRSAAAKGAGTLSLSLYIYMYYTHMFLLFFFCSSPSYFNYFCLDGSLPAYHLHRGYGSGANSWLIQLEGGGWCNSIRSCVYRKKTRRGSSYYMEKQIPFNFFNWNRVKVRYCDGASFAGDSENKALLSGCSAGGLASILHCDEFRGIMPRSTKVKCLSDAGLFLDSVDVAGGHTLRNMFSGVVSLQGLQKNLPRTCTNRLDATSCFFPQNLIANIRTPMFLLNAAYDSWQVQASLAPPSADPHGYWLECKLNHARCSTSQIQFLQGARSQVQTVRLPSLALWNHMLNVMKGFSMNQKNGLFVNSCFAHCQSERQDTWFADDSPLIGNKGIALAVGDWYFDRSGIRAVDCAYPCDKTCHNLVFK
ncbi:hypothetical protein LguiB_006457 [Lonicera macranthoides]